MYQDLEDDASGDEHQNQAQSAGAQSHYPKSDFEFACFDDDFFEEEAALPENSRSLAIHQIRSSDTRVFDGSSTSIGTIQSISSLSGSIQGSVAGSAAGSGRGSLVDLSIHSYGSMQSPAVPQFQERRRAFQKSKKQGTDGGGFIPVMPNKAGHIPPGFRFQKHAADEDPASNFIIDVKDQKITGSYKGKAKRSRPASNNPHDAEYDPLNFVLGHTKGIVVRTDPTNLTTKNLYQLDRSQTMTASGIPTVLSCMALPTDGRRPLYPASGAGINATNSGGRKPVNVSQVDSLLQDESVDTDPMSWEPSADIDETIRKNFVPEDEVIIHQARKTQFERQNSEWSNSAALEDGFNMANVYVNHFGDDNVVKTEVAAETRLLNWDQYGNYKGEYQGSVKKRIRLWAIEQYKWWDAEMKAASDAYRELMEMRPVERMEAINAARMPITHWAGGSRAAARDVSEQNDLPAIYRKKWDAQKERRERLERIVKVPAKAASLKSLRSEASQYTSKTAPVHGKLGDMDGPLNSTSATQHGTHGVGKTRNSQRHVYALAERAVRAKSIRQTSTPGSNQRQRAGRGSRDDGPVRSSPSGSTITPTRGGGFDVGSFSGGSGYSVTGPRSVASQDKYRPLGSRPSHAQSRYTCSKQGSKFGSFTSSTGTNRGKNDKASIRTDIAGAELLELDDSPLFHDLSDISFPLDGLNTSQVEQLKLAEKQANTRGRVVLVRLHATVEFSGEAIAKRVFGGSKLF